MAQRNPRKSLRRVARLATMTDMTTTQHPTYVLSHLAGCADPDTHDGLGFDFVAVTTDPISAGALWLRQVEDAYLEAVEYGNTDTDDLHELADGAVPIYNHERWQVFVDLAAWQVDTISDYGPSENLTDAAGIALYIIAETLLEALAGVNEVEA